MFMFAACTAFFGAACRWACLGYLLRGLLVLLMIETYDLD
jgi:hypothetical protein